MFKIWIVFTCLLWNQPFDSAQNKTDTSGLHSFIRSAYRWHNDHITSDQGFEPLKMHASDTFYTGIDMRAVNYMLRKLRGSGFFSEVFLTNYRSVAVRMNKELKNGTAAWREGALPPFYQDADPWCDCPDAPGRYWSKITITEVKNVYNGVFLKWTRGDKIYYTVGVKRENGNWKITYLEGYDQTRYHWGKE